MCGNKCVYSDSDSSATEAKCILPSLSTSKSITSFGIQTAGPLYSKKYFGTASQEEIAKLFDKNNANFITDTSKPCHVGMEFREGYVGVLSKARFFLDTIADKGLYENTTF